ncbi:Histone chaperone asf1 [Malassezia vespertilionis]|nr:Histone chaperone asf1 [Malassezia vespertilionis]WFD05585.1 Histone chaperone asf1 [Malassezia vespertilionis]
MSIVHLQNVEIVNPVARFSDAYIFKVTFECIAPLEDDIEWKLIYVGSAESEKYDQELDSCMVGPVPVGVNSFEFEAEAPSPEKIPAHDLLGVTVILLTGSYNDAEFIRVGYYVNNAYEDEELRENPPEQVELNKVRREVLASKPRVTRFNINWNDPNQPIAPPEELADFGGANDAGVTVETVPKPQMSASESDSVPGSSFVALQS